MCIKWLWLRKFALAFLAFIFSFLMFFPTGSVFADDTTFYPQYGATVNANGVIPTGNKKPREILELAWQHCYENYCDGVPITVAEWTSTTACGGGSTRGCTIPHATSVKFSGSYSGGWTTRDNWVKALLEFGGEDGGWFDASPVVGGFWKMRSFWAIRSPNNSDWINVNLD